MSRMSTIRFLQRHEIENAKWDQCVLKAPNGWLYARTFYLDGMGDWGGLILDDYEYIMPLPWRKKWGFDYIYPPAFSGQLGIISEKNITATIVKQFIESIPDSFKLCDLMMNELNPSFSSENIVSIQRTNYVIPLKDGYDTVSAAFNDDAKKNIRRAKANSLILEENVSMQAVITMYKQAYGNKNKHISGRDYLKFDALAQRCIQLKLGFTVGVKNPENELVATAFFGIDEKRIYYLLGAPSLAGRKLGAVHFLINEIIRKFSGERLLFDFEGSDILSVSQFYLKFGPVVKHYQFIRLNNLPNWANKIWKLKNRL
jgi:hypothetical protein